MSYRKIVTVVTEHTASTVVARYAISMAAACRAELLLYAVIEEGSGEATMLHTNRHLDHLLTAALELDIQAKRITEAGELSALLPVRVQAEKADLVFYPLMRFEPYGANLQRHTVHHLLRTIRCDLSITKVVHMAKPHPRHILIPLGKRVRDGERRLLFSAELARSFQSQVTLLHLSSQAGDPIPEEVSRFRNGLQQRRITVLERSGTGQIGKSVRIEAITRHHDLILVGASERGVLRRILFGNPADEVIRHPPCNAILFRGAR